MSWSRGRDINADIFSKYPILERWILLRCQNMGSISVIHSTVGSIENKYKAAGWARLHPSDGVLINWLAGLLLLLGSPAAG